MEDARVAIHVALSSVLAIQAFLLGLPQPTFETAPSFWFMSTLMTENHWAVLLAGFSVLGAVGAITSNKLFRLITVGILSSVHATLGLGFLVSNPGGLAVGVYIPWAGLGYYLAWRRLREGI